MWCPRCHASIPAERSARFCGNCGTILTSRQAWGVTITFPTEKTILSNYQSQVVARDTVRLPLERPSPSPARTDSPSPAPLQRSALPAQPPQLRPPHHPIRSSRHRILIAFFILLLLAGVTLGITFPLTTITVKPQPGVSPSGQAVFLDSQQGLPGQTDALSITTQDLGPPPVGFQYQAWLINEQTERLFALGPLLVRSHTSSLRYTGDGKHGRPGTNVLGAGNKLIITLEHVVVQAPTGKAVLTGTFPPQAFVHIRHLLVSFPTVPGKLGLLVGLRKQTQLLKAQALVLEGFASSRNEGAITCAAQSLIDIIEGMKGTHYHPLADWCASLAITTTGDGFGLLGSNGYVAVTAAHAILAATQPDTTDNIRVRAEQVRVAITNIKGWVTTIEQDALHVLNTPTDTRQVPLMAQLANQVYSGTDTDNDDRVDPVVGEAGAITAYIHGQLMATLPLVSHTEQSVG